MKKFLTVLWGLIIIGSIFIGIMVSQPGSHPNGIKVVELEDNTKIPIENIDIETAPPNTSSSEALSSYSEHIAMGDKNISNGELDSAIENYISAISLNSQSIAPLIKLGETYLLNNQPTEAEETFKKAENIDPQSIIIQLGLARSRLNLRDYEGAKEIVWKLDKNNSQVKYYTALILILAEDTEGAKTLFQEIEKNEATETVLKIKVQSFLNAYETFSYYKEGEMLHLKILLGKAFTEVGEYEAAIPILFKVIEEKNNYRDAWIVLGYAYLNSNKIIDAIDALDQARALDQEQPETLFFLGLAHFANNEIEKAISYLEKADQFGFEPKEQIDLKLGDLYLLQGNYEASAVKYEKVLQRNPSNLGLFVRTTWLNIDKLHNYDKALQISINALEVHPNDAMSYNLAGWAYTAKDDFQEAKKYLTRALEIQPNFDAANLNMGWLYEKQGAKTLAKEYYKKAYLLGNGNAIATLAATRFNNIQQP